MRIATIGAVKVKLLAPVAVARKALAEQQKPSAWLLAGLSAMACLWLLGILALYRSARGKWANEKLLKPF